MVKIIFNGFKSKKNILFLLMFLTSFLCILILLTTKDYYKDIVENNIGKSRENTKIIIYNNKKINMLEELNQIKEIKKVYQSSILFGSLNNKNYKLISTINKDSNLIKNEIIVPKELENELNKTLKIVIFDKDYDLKIVNITEEDEIIISCELFETIIDNNNLDVISYIVYTDNYKDSIKVIDYFGQKNIMAILENDNGVKKINDLNIFVSNLSKFIIFLICIFIFLSFFICKTFIQSEIKKMAILKAIGYNNFQIVFIYTMKVLILLIFSNIIVIIFFGAITNFISLFNHSNYLYFISKVSYINDYFKYSLLFFIIILVNFIQLNHKLHNVDVIKVINDV